MNSIHRNQPEQNREDLRGASAIGKIKELVDVAKTGFFCTLDPRDGSWSSRPMNVRQVDDDGNLWFLGAMDSRLVEELSQHPSAVLHFQGSSNSDFLELRGTASLSNDREKINELWEPILKTWFTEGIDDPRITVIKLTPTSGYYWDTKHGNMVAGLKMMVGAAIGKTLDDSIEGSIEV